MDTKQLSEQILRIATGANINDDQKIDIREIQLLVGQQVAYFAKRNYLENGNIDGINYIDNQFISTYKNVDVLVDRDLDEKYSILPSTPISLPRTGGVYQVSGMKGQDKPFLPIDSTTIGMFGKLETFNQSCERYYYVSGNRIYYRGISNIKRVLIELVSEGDAVVPKEYETEIIANVMKIIGIENNIPQDKINDGLGKA